MRKLNLVVLRNAILFCTISAGTAAHAAINGSGIDAVLVLDSSGSMKQNDPHMLRASAAKLFISLLGANDRVAVISFSDKGYPVIGLTSAQTQQDRARLFSAVDKINSRGAFTNLHAALTKAQELLQRGSTSKRPRYILFLTDGKMDTGNKKQDAVQTQKIRDALVPQIEKQGVSIYTIAFTRDSDTVLLREMAGKTRGLFHVAQTDKDLHSIFLSFFEGSKKPDMLPIEGGTFRIDNSIKEVTIVAMKQKQETQVALEDPAGKRHVGNRVGPGFRWLATEHFEMITAIQPAAGLWKLVSDGGQSHAYIVTDMKLDTDMGKEVSAGVRPVVQAWLSQEGKVLAQKEILLNTRFSAEVVRPDGTIVHLPLLDNGRSGDSVSVDGIYSNQSEAAVPGSHEIRLTAQNPTFERKITRTFTALSTPPVSDKAAEGEHPVAGDKGGAVGSSETSAVPVSETKVAPDVSAVAPDRPAPAEHVAVSQSVLAHSRVDNGANIWIVLGVFTLINLLVGGTAFGVYSWMRKKKTQSGLIRFMEPGMDNIDAMDGRGVREAGKT